MATSGVGCSSKIMTSKYTSNVCDNMNRCRLLTTSSTLQSSSISKIAQATIQTKMSSSTSQIEVPPPPVKGPIRFMKRLLPVPPGYAYRSNTPAIPKTGRMKGIPILPSRGDELTFRKQFIRAGLPFIGFSLLSFWAVRNALDGKTKERDASMGNVSISLRQLALQEEHDEMMDRLNQIVKQKFDNTKRIKRPEEVLAERKAERDRRNRWYNRFYRYVYRIEK